MKIFLNQYAVMAGLVPAIHVFAAYFWFKTWMPGIKPGMTMGLVRSKR